MTANARGYAPPQRTTSLARPARNVHCIISTKSPNQSASANLRGMYGITTLMAARHADRKLFSFVQKIMQDPRFSLEALGEVWLLAGKLIYKEGKP